MPTFVVFFIVLIVLVLIHELGHFIAAKWAKMQVDEFAFGFPPRLFSYKKGGTEYSFNLLPLGGYVKILGENGDKTETKNSKSFSSAPKYKQIIVLCAGVFMNILLAVFLLSFSYFLGVKSSTEDVNLKQYFSNQKMVFSSVLPNSPSDKAGLKQLDEVTRVSSGLEELPVISAEGFVNFVSKHQEDNIEISFKENKIEKTVIVKPEGGLVEGRKIIGLSMAEIGDLKLPPLKAIEKGIFDTYKYTVLTFDGFYNLIKDLFTGKAKEAAKNLTGPIGIFSLVGEAKNEGLGSLLAFMALISINLAVLNILPLPALDGGRILFVLIEIVTRKPLSQNAQAYINGIFFFLLISLMVLVTIKDIIKYF